MKIKDLEKKLNENNIKTKEMYENQKKIENEFQNKNISRLYNKIIILLQILCNK